jgi:hypothetical protein
MQQRQLRLGDILDDYCPRERRVTNHAVVAMVGEEVKQTRCTTCDAEHAYKQAKIPRQRRKDEAPAALYAQVAAGAPKRVVPSQQANAPDNVEDQGDVADPVEIVVVEETVLEAEPVDQPALAAPKVDADDGENNENDDVGADDGPVHRPLIRASLPRPDGQQPPARPIPEFTIRQPGGGRPNRFRPRHFRGGQGHQGHQGGQGGQGYQFQGNRSNGNVAGPGRGPRPNAGRHGQKRHGPSGRKRSK